MMFNCGGCGTWERFDAAVGHGSTFLLALESRANTKLGWGSQESKLQGEDALHDGEHLDLPFPEKAKSLGTFAGAISSIYNSGLTLIPL